MVSKKSTFGELLMIISTKYKENSKRGRLWIEEEVISGMKLEETLEQFGISMGQVLYVEYSNANNQWPSDKFSEEKKKIQKTKTDKGDQKKTSGLYNLGNSKILC